MKNTFRKIYQHKKTVLLIGLAVLAMVGGLVLTTERHGKVTHKDTEKFRVEIPVNYTEPLVIASFGNLLNITPLEAKSVEKIEEGNNTIRYIDAYQNTDVEQIKYPNKLKESLILKGPEHPDRFEYELGNLGDYEWEFDQDNNLVFYTTRISANTNTDQRELRRVFTIPEPFMYAENTKTANLSGSYENVNLTRESELPSRDNDSTPENSVKKHEGMDNENMAMEVRGIEPPSSWMAIPNSRQITPMADSLYHDTGKVEMKIEGNRLILIPDKDWIEKHEYPIVVDPTVEINVLNLYSHPFAGDDWIVEFTTRGKADLKIIPADQATIDDDEFIGLWCGDEKRQSQILAGDVIYYPDWECDGIGKVVHYTLKAGKHHLIFEFGSTKEETEIVKAEAFNDGESWLAGWDYRKSHTITGSAGAGTNYQIKMTVYYGSGSDSGGSVYLDSKGETDFGDIRFTDNDGSTELDYWMESKTDSDNAVFWVEVADTLESNAIIYIYYGKTGETTTSNGADTFLFFDDFSGDLSKWSRDITSGVYPEIPSGQEYVRCGGGSTSPPYGHTSLGSSSTYTGFNNNALIYRARVSTNGIGEVAFRGSYGGNTGYKNRFDQRSGQGNSFLKPPYSGWNFLGSCTADGDRPAVDTWYVYEITATGSNFKMYRDGALKKSCSDASYSSAGEIALQNHYGSYTDYDWVGVRKFVATEPAHSTWGEEETAPVESASQSKAELKSGTIKIQSGTMKINYLNKASKG